MKIGSHVSNNGNLMLIGSALEALSYGSNCFMVYLGAPQNTYRKPFEQLNSLKMKEILQNNNINIEDVIVHAPYIVNLAQPDFEKRKFAIDLITKELQVMAKIGFKYLVIHPGAHMKNGIDAGLDLIIDSFKQILANTKEDNTVLTIETMAGKGSECCFEFSHIKKIINAVGSDRVGVCLDTCHIFDAGYDIVNDYDNVINNFNDIVGLNNLKVIHINDSKNVCGSHKDRHANFGFGNIGFDTLIKFVYDERFLSIPKILETPYVNDCPPYKYEIEMIKNKLFDKYLLDKISKEWLSWNRSLILQGWAVVRVVNVLIML